jgi:DNA repair protein RecN (Recombination protein N)|tara:strand:- start:10317 stop:11969 length:1653 start_codon:yes stop_codon:yes gene_type:complete
MLSKIKIKNYALINKLEVSFDKGFSSITGETGAGKSIILGALGLTLGQRVDTTVLKDTESKCIIETWFNIKNLNLNSFFSENELDYEDETILRREILPSGKSRAFVNDTPVSLLVLKSLSENLIDVHSQHQTLLLNDSHFQLKLIDTNANNSGLLTTYSTFYKQFTLVSNELETLKNQEQKLKSDSDYFQFQYNELEVVGLENIDENDLQEELDLLNNAEEIKFNFTNTIDLLDSDNGIISKLKEVENSLMKISSTSNKTKEIQERLSSILIDLQDVQNEIEETDEEVVFDQERINLLTEKLNVINNLHQKHSTNSVSELIEIKEKIENNLLLVNNFEIEIEKLEAQKVSILKELNSASTLLSKSRKSVVASIEKEMKEMLSELAMKDAELKIEITEKDTYSFSGKDQVNFLFKANKGGSFNAIQKVASGGELSRLMLCIKTNLASKKQLPTLIFDEIDTGVSGDIASKMGDMMNNIGESTQVISITHLPQIAGKGNSHYKVYKEVEGETTHTKMQKLTNETRIVELAKMLSGASVTDAALANAKTLLNN